MKLLHAALLTLALAGCGPAAQVEVEQARVMLPVIPDRPGSAYFIIESRGGTGPLTAVSSPRVQRIELHETVQEGGRSSMRPVTSAAFDDTGRIAFEPGGKHAMLFGIDPAVQAGGRIPFTFTFQGQPPITVEADVQAAGSAGAHAGH